MSLPDWLLWLLPVPAATSAAMAWAWWSSRSRGLQDPSESMQAHERFRAALAAPAPTTGRANRPLAPGPRPAARRL